MSGGVPVVQHSMSDLERMAEAFAKSGMFGAKSKEQALALLLLAHGEGLHPAIAMRDFDVIQGRPAKKTEAMLRSFIAAGGSVEWHQMDDKRADATFSHPQGGRARIDWDMERAKVAGIGGKDNWKKYPRQMLANRVISEGCRRIYPASTSGLYEPGEVADMGREKDVTPAAGALAALPHRDQDMVRETADKVIELLRDDRPLDAYALWQDSRFDADQEVAFWSLIPDSKARAALKALQANEGAKERKVISPAKHKRLEAMIKEFGLDRERLKDWCALKFNKGHFNELTDDEYRMLDEHIASIGKTTAAPQNTALKREEAIAESDENRSGISAGAATYITKEQLQTLLSYCEQLGVNISRVLLKVKVASAEEIPAGMYQRCIDFVDAASKK